MKWTFFVLALVFAMVAFGLSLDKDYGQRERFTVEAAGSGVDIASDGGACGFGILSGLCFVSASIIAAAEKKTAG